MTGEELRTLIFAHIHHRKPLEREHDRFATWGDLECWVRVAYDDLAACLTLHDQEMK